MTVTAFWLANDGKESLGASAAVFDADRVDITVSYVFAI
jgi:hypothetical protein